MIVIIAKKLASSKIAARKFLIFQYISKNAIKTSIKTTYSSSIAIKVIIIGDLQ